MAITFDHDNHIHHSNADARTRWHDRYRLFRMVRHAEPAAKDSSTALMLTLVVGLLVWTVIFAAVFAFSGHLY